MKRGIIEVVRINENLREMLPSYSLYPRIADDILLVIDSEKAQMKVARIKHSGSDDTQKDNAIIESP
jgi:hypothetical protein